MANTGLIGSTGLVGGHILSTLLTHPAVARVDTISRRNPPAAGSNPNVKLTTVVDSDTSHWAAQVAALSPPPSIFFSALGTTRAAAGGFENQYKIDHDLNVELARAARDSGSRVYVLISSAGTDPSSTFAYSRMKGSTEEDIKALGFERTVILRPAFISGQREESRSGIESALHFFAGVAGKVHRSLKDSWAQDAEVIAKAAVQAGLKALEGNVPVAEDKVWILNCSDIIRLGRTEWEGKQ